MQCKRTAEKLLKRMKETKLGWRYDDLDRLYKGFGFDVKQGGKHTIYIHPKYPELRTVVGRHRSLTVGYINDAVKLINELKRREGKNNG